MSFIAPVLVWAGLVFVAEVAFRPKKKKHREQAWAPSAADHKQAEHAVEKPTWDCTTCLWRNLIEDARCKVCNKIRSAAPEDDRPQLAPDGRPVAIPYNPTREIFRPMPDPGPPAAFAVDRQPRRIRNNNPGCLRARAQATNGSVNKLSPFEKAFAAAHYVQGPGGTFEWRGKLYSTDRADGRDLSARAKAPRARPAVQADAKK